MTSKYKYNPLLKAGLDIAGSNSDNDKDRVEFIQGKNITITDNGDGTKTISADVPEVEDDALHYGENNFSEHEGRDVIINGTKTSEQGQNDLRITSDRAELKMTSNKPNDEQMQSSVSQLTHDKILFEKKTIENENTIKYTTYKQTQQDIKLEASGKISSEAKGTIKIYSGNSKITLGTNGADEVLRINGQKIQTPSATEVDFASKLRVSDIQGDGKIAAHVSEMDIKSPDGLNRYMKTSEEGTIVNTRFDVKEPEKENDLRLKGDGFETNIYDAHQTKTNRIKLTAGGDIHITHANSNPDYKHGIEIEGRGEVANEGHIHIAAVEGITIGENVMENMPKDDDGLMRVRSESGSIAMGHTEQGLIFAEGSHSIAFGVINDDSGNSEYSIRSSGVASIAGGMIYSNDGDACSIETYSDSGIAFGYVEGQDSDYMNDSELGSGSSIIANGVGSVAIGNTIYGSVRSEADASQALGSGVQTGEECSLARGIFAFANGKGSCASGIGVKALGKGAHAEGYGVLFSHPIIELQNGHCGVKLKGYKEAREVWFLRQKSEVEFYLHFKSINGRGGRHHLLELSQLDLYVNNRKYTEEDYWYFRDNDSADGYNFYLDLNCGSVGDKCDVIVWTNAVAQGSHAEGKNTLAVGKNSHAENLVNMARGQNSHVEGHLNYTAAENSHAEGYRNISGGKQAHTEGANNYAIGENSHAGGESSFALGKDASVQGRSLFATGHAAYAEGRGVQFDGEVDILRDEEDYLSYDGDCSYDGIDDCHLYTPSEHNPDYFHVGQVLVNRENNGQYGKILAIDGSQLIIIFDSNIDHFNDGVNVMACSGAFGDYSHVEGRSTIASGQDAHAEGYQTIASGNHSHAEGDNTRASKIGSHAEGHETIASGDYQHVSGKYNVEDANNEYAEIVGGGSSNEMRKNIRTLDWDGIEAVNGVKSLDINKQSSSKYFATNGSIQEIPIQRVYTSGQGIQFNNNRIEHNLLGGDNITITDNNDGSTEISSNQIDDTMLSKEKTFSSDYIDNTYVKEISGNIVSKITNAPTGLHGSNIRLCHNDISGLWLAVSSDDRDKGLYAYSKVVLPTRDSDWTLVNKLSVGLNENQYDSVQQVGEYSYMTNQFQVFARTKDGLSWESVSGTVPSGTERSWLIQFNNRYYIFNQLRTHEGYLPSNHYYYSTDGQQYSMATFFSSNKTYYGFGTPCVYKNKLYVPTASGILLVTSDGSTWQELDLVGKPHSSRSEANTGDALLGFIGYNDKLVALSSASFVKSTGAELFGQTSVYVSDDDGTTWNKYTITPNDKIISDAADDNGDTTKCYSLANFAGKLAVIMRNGDIYMSNDAEHWVCYASKYSDPTNGLLTDLGIDGYYNFFYWNGYFIVSSSEGVKFISTNSFIGTDSYITFHNQLLISTDEKNHIIGLFNNLIIYNYQTEEYSLSSQLVNLIKQAVSNN